MGFAFEYGDDLADGPTRGRGAGLNPSNRFEPIRVHVLGEQSRPAARRRGRQCGLGAHNRLLGHGQDGHQPVDSTDLGFKWSLNPCRGCEHGCVYCCARPYHEMLGFSCGLDFETRIMAKTDAPQLLRRGLVHTG